MNDAAKEKYEIYFTETAVHRCSAISLFWKISQSSSILVQFGAIQKWRHHKNTKF